MLIILIVVTSMTVYLIFDIKWQRFINLCNLLQLIQLTILIDV